METPTIYILTGYAGSGKDFFADQLSKTISGQVFNTTFARKIKESIECNLPSEIIKAFPNILSSKEIVDTLKNNNPNFIVYDDGEQSLNMRSFMQTLLGGCIRGIEKDIHAIYELQEIHRILTKNKDAKFVCTDNRYENEQNYFIGVNLCQNHTDRINYLQNSIHEVGKRISINSIHENFDKYFPISEDRINDIHLDFLVNIKHDFIESIQDIKKYKPVESHINYDLISSMNFKEFSQDCFAQLGVFNIFREAVPANYEINLNKESDLRNAIKEHAHLDDKQIDLLFQNYKESNLSLKDLKKYGVCRTNPTLPSESELYHLGRQGYTINNIGGAGEQGVKLSIEKIVSSKKTKQNNHKPNNVAKLSLS